MRNLIAIVSGSITSFFLQAVFAFLMMRFDIKPFSDFARGTVTANNFFIIAQKIIYLYYLVLIPSIAFISGIVAALLAKNKEYIVGLLSILPAYIIVYDFSLTYFLMIFVASVLMLFGVRVAVYLKKSSIF